MGTGSSRQERAPREKADVVRLEYMKNLNAQLRLKCFTEDKPEACHQLAEYLIIFAKKNEEAFKLFQRTCLKDMWGPSCSQLGHMLLHAKGTERDAQVALKMYNRSCRLVHGKGCTMAGMIHAMGVDDIPQNLDKAAEFFALGCKQEEKSSCQQLAILKRYGPKDYPVDQQQALELFSQACRLGSVSSCIEAAQMYEKGIGVEVNLDEAAKLLKRAKQLHVGEAATEERGTGAHA